MRKGIGWKGLVAIAAIGTAGIAFAAWVVSFARTNTAILVPKDVALAAPGPEVPKGIAAFAGVWAGDRWDGGTPHALVVERVEEDGSAEIVYALGADRSAGEVHSFRRLQARIVDGHLGFVLPNNHDTLDYSFAADGRLLGRMTTPVGWRSYALLQRVASGDRARILAKARERSDPLWRDIRIRERPADGDPAARPIELEATLYESLLPGRHPLIVLNHGSPNDDDAQPGQTLRFESAARFLLSLGYSVIAPMRKGRGESGGAAMETADLSDRPPPEAQLASGIEDIDAVIDAMRARPFVDPSRIVVAGYGRGGLLAVAYAGRHPEKIAGVIDFSGGWWPEGDPRDAVADTAIAAAGRRTKLPMLWICGNDDPDHSLAQAAREFDLFRKSGGRGVLYVVRDAQVRNLRPFLWTAKWEGIVGDYLREATGEG